MSIRHKTLLMAIVPIKYKLIQSFTNILFENSTFEKNGSIKVKVRNGWLIFDSMHKLLANK